LLVRLAIVGLLAFACYRLRAIITTICVGAIIAYVLDPLVEWLARRPRFVAAHGAAHRRIVSIVGAITRPRSSGPVIRRPEISRHTLRTIATIYVFILSAFVLWKGTVLVVTPFASEFNAARSPAAQKAALANKDRLISWYNSRAPEWGKSDRIEEAIRHSDLGKTASSYVAQIGERVLDAARNVVEVVLLPVLAFYFIIDGRKLRREFVGLVPKARRRETVRMLYEFNRIMRAFVAGQFLLCVLAGVVVGAFLALLHVRFPVILGVIAGLTRAIPIIGPIVGGIPIILLTLAMNGFTTALIVLGFFTFMHFAESKFIMPMIIGDRMNLHPVIIIIVLLVGGEMGGFLIGGALGSLLGMFFAAPLAALIRVMVRRYWLGIRATGRATKVAAAKAQSRPSPTAASEPVAPSSQAPTSPPIPVHQRSAVAQEQGTESGS
jgi:predicted PurR-regulated permease PerM